MKIPQPTIERERAKSVNRDLRKSQHSPISFECKECAQSELVALNKQESK